MLFAYGAFRAGGERAIREAVRCGPGRLLALYARAASATADLPALPDGLRTASWPDLCGGR